jgi:CPA2 family monovalent cation:H+ antiporter-2
LTDVGLLLDIVAAVLVAFAGGALAQRLGLPVVVGYLIAGVAIGPFTPGFHANPHSIDVLAQIGVTFLMFAIGAEFSRSELRRLGRVGLLGGVAQIVATAAIGPALAPLLGFTTFEGVFLGALLALSSTVVALKLLGARGEVGNLHGHVALGILVAQDLAAIPLIVVLPHAGAPAGAMALDLLRAAGEAVALVLGAYVVGVRAVVVQPEFEAGVEVIRHTLQRYGVMGAEPDHLIAGRRRVFYEHPSTDPLNPAP